MDIFTWLAVHFDLPILNWIMDHLWCPFLDTVMPVITLFGDDGIFWIICAVVLLIFKKTRRTGLAMGLALLMGLLICNVTLKPLIARPRPYDFSGIEIDLLVEALHDFSFPSGHTIASFEAATVLLLNNKKLGVPAMILASLIAFSRLYLYVHYPTDVIVAIILGIGIAFLANWIVKKGFQVYEKKKQAA